MKILPGVRLFSGDVFYGDWVERRGENMIARAECVDRDGTGGSVTISFFTKDKDDTGGGTEVDNGSFQPYQLVVDTKGSITTELVESSTSSSYGMKDLVRCKYAWGGGSSGHWILVRQFPFIYFDTADGSKT